MNKQELEEVLLLNKVPKDLYSLSGGLPNESYCLEKEKIDGMYTIAKEE